MIFFFFLDGLYIISIEDIKKWNQQNINLIPGTKLCKICKKELNNKSEEGSLSQNEESESDIEFLPENNSSFKIDKSLQQYGISPIKKHSKSNIHRQTEVKRKICKAQNQLNELAQIVTNEKTFSVVEEEKVKKLLSEKAEYFDEMVKSIKDKISTSDKRTITQLLTLAPPSMTKENVIKYFNVTDFQAKKAKKLYNEKGLLAMPPQYRGKTLSEDIVNIVKNFYENDKYSRLMPGKKDCKCK